jgi:iron complex outermembrane receptor protein
LVTVVGDRGFGPEDLRAHELGYRVQPSRTLSLDAATFYNVYDNLVTARLGAPVLARSPSPHLVLPARVVSGAGGRSYGLELAANWNPAERCRFAGGYTGFRMRLQRAPGTAPITTGASTRSPNHQLHARSYLDLTPTLQLDTAFYYVSAMAGIGVPSYHRLDTRLGWRPTAELDLSLGLQNLLDSRHPEFLAETLTQRTEIGRNIYGKVTWRF